ncbi:MAG: hypothetical protein FWC47_00005, partial [Oscillospiraceae bacterium]|nr:hypothetical protein [Oscillospiraceae bacterium]
NYAFRIAERYCTSKLPKLKLVIIYTGEVESAPSSLDFIDGDYLNKVEEWIKMTSLERIFDDLFREQKKKILREKEEALREKDEEKIEAVNEAKIETQKKIARNMLKKNTDIVYIMEITGFTKAQILELKKQEGNSVN